MASDRPRPVRVLLVDDNVTILGRVTEVLTPGCVVVGAVRDGPTAIEMAKALRPDVIVLDMSMPGMSGLEVATRLRREGVTAAVVILTVYDDKALIVAAREAGASGYVLKQRIATDLMLAVQEARAGRSFVSTT